MFRDGVSAVGRAGVGLIVITPRALALVLGRHLLDSTLEAVDPVLVDPGVLGASRHVAAFAVIVLGGLLLPQNST